MDSFDREEIGSINHEEDNFSDTDNEEQWQEESMLPATQTTYVWERNNRMEIASVGNSVLLPGN